MSLSDPQTDDEREQAICFVIVKRPTPDARFRPHGICLGEVARDSMMAFALSNEPGVEFAWLSLERAE